MSIKRILIVGNGSIGKRHLRLARKLLPSADIRVLHYRDFASIPKYSNGCFATIEQAIDFCPEIAVVANPASCHIKVAKALAYAGIHLLIEKPLSNSIEGVSELLETSLEKKTVLLIGYNLRFFPSLQRFRDLLKENVIGRVLSVRCEIGQYLPSWRPDDDYRRSVSARSDLGGGALLELSHEIDYLRWIFGEVEWVTALLSRQSKLEINVEDSAHLILGFSPTSDGHILIGTLVMDFVRHDTTRLCTAIGEYGSLRWNGLTGVVEEFVVGAKEWREVFRHQRQSDDSYLAEWGNFLSCVYGKQVPMISGEDGLRVLQIIDAVRQSSELGTRVHVVKKQAREKGRA